jgi:hypothetical protein
MGGPTPPPDGGLLAEVLDPELLDPRLLYEPVP